MEPVQITVTIPAELAAKLQDVSGKSDLTIEELLIGSAELMYQDASQKTMKRIMRNTFARRFEAKLQNFTVRTRKAAGGENNG